MLDSTIADLPSVRNPFLNCLAKMKPDQDAREPVLFCCLRETGEGTAHLLGTAALVLGAQAGSDCRRVKLTWSVSKHALAAPGPQRHPGQLWPES